MNRTRQISSCDQRVLGARLAVTCVALAAFSCSSLGSPQPQNPYRSIALRYVCGRPPRVPPAKTTAVPLAPAPTIVLTGITTIFGDKRALLEITAPPAKGQPPARPEPCISPWASPTPGSRLWKSIPNFGT
jgi:hypothetical protein